VNLALRLGIPALVVSLTIVAFGTSAPELLISVQAVLQGVPGIAIGNVVGSNTANILLVLGFPAILAALHTSACESRKTYIQMIVATVVFIGLAFRGVFDFYAGLLLLAMLAYMLLDAVREAQMHRRMGDECCDPDLDEPEGMDPDMPWWKIIVFLVLGLIGLPLGADLLVDAAQVIARDFGVSESVIGLTLVALGTSLPELATTTMAALRRQADVAIGNVIGSNMFNLLGVLGIAATISPIEVHPTILARDFPVMFLLTGLMFLLASDFRGPGRIGRTAGVLLLTIFCGFQVMVWMDAGSKIAVP